LKALTASLTEQAAQAASSFTKKKQMQDLTIKSLGLKNKELADQLHSAVKENQEKAQMVR